MLHDPHNPRLGRSHDVTLELLERVRSGDEGAWECLHDRYRDALSTMARGSLEGDLRRRLDTEDIVQSTFLAAHAGLADFEHRGRGSLQAWLRQILVNQVRQRLRSHLCDQRDVRRHEEAETLETHHDLSLLSPGEALLAAEEQLRFVEELGNLPESDREIIIATQIEGEPVSAVAARLGINEATVRRRRVIAIARMAKKLQ